jgi:hypothetical protein
MQNATHVFLIIVSSLVSATKQAKVAWYTHLHGRSLMNLKKSSSFPNTQFQTRVAAETRAPRPLHHASDRFELILSGVK